MDGLNEMRTSVYRATVKLVSLQKGCHMDVISVSHITEAVSAVIGGQPPRRSLQLNTEDMSRTLIRMFHSVDHEIVAAAEDLCSLMLRLYDRTQAGCVSAASFQTALIALSADRLLDKYRALLSVSENSAGAVSRSGLRLLLQDLSQVPAAVQEGLVFGSVEAAVRSCFQGILSPTLSPRRVLSWLQSNPRLLLWLPTLYRLSLSQNVTHAVRCHTCETFPITGIRYRCIKCVKVHVCQSCFLTDRQTRKHKTHHPVLEFCTQPTWRESLSSVVHSACYALLPRRHTRREADRRKVLMWLDPGESQNSDAPPTDVSAQVAQSPTFNRDVSRHASVDSFSHSSSSKALQTDGEILTQQADPAVLLSNEVKTLHKEKNVIEQELQVWRLAAQSEHGRLEDRCSELEVTMENMRQHHQLLQCMLTQVLNKIENQQHVNNVVTEAPQQSDTRHGAETQYTDTGNRMSKIQRNTEEDDDDDEDDRAKNQSTPSPTINWDAALSDLQYEEESAGETCLCHPTGRQDGRQEEQTCLSEEEENVGMCSPEKLLQDIIDRLKTVMDTDRCRERQTDEKERARLLEAADQVGDCIHGLVLTMRTNPQTRRVTG